MGNTFKFLTIIMKYFIICLLLIAHGAGSAIPARRLMSFSDILATGKDKLIKPFEAQAGSFTACVKKDGVPVLKNMAVDFGKIMEKVTTRRRLGFLDSIKKGVSGVIKKGKDAV